MFLASVKYCSGNAKLKSALCLKTRFWCFNLINLFFAYFVAPDDADAFSPLVG